MIAQIVIGIFGVLSVIIANDPRPRVARWGCICGLVAQPAWFVMTWHAEQWGAFAAAFFYSYGWLRGLWYQWLRPAQHIV